ncbi:MAG: MoaD/ThiS family protein [Candidatus Heimdallarchaeota archaeon]|nr:MoaD/ThiS family protein [Candidatus Heimdallarchaeota archaeon]
MKVIIRSFAMIREAVGQARIELNVKSTDSLLDIVTKFCHQFPSTKQFIFTDTSINRNLVFAVNGNEVSNDMLNDQFITENDELAIVPPAGGG